MYRIVDKKLKATDDLSLLALSKVTTWDDEEFDRIANLALGKSLSFDSEYLPGNLVVTRVA